ncbi:MAG: 2-amino-4-hydroxy-6-hydroxymethyldihydropteridine diphosphokinase [Burkholderiales bacterium]
MTCKSEPAPSRRRRRCEAWIGLGANLGDTAFSALTALPRTRLRARSSLYRSAPIDAGGPDYLNAVVLIDTGLDAHELLAHLLAIEGQHGRERLYPNSPRTLDLDLLLYGEAQIESSTLTVPHPRLHTRAFVLAPLAELAPALSIPGRGRVAALLQGVAAQPIERLAGTAWRRKTMPTTSAAAARSASASHKPPRDS